MDLKWQHTRFLCNIWIFSVSGLLQLRQNVIVTCAEGHKPPDADHASTLNNLPPTADAMKGAWMCEM